MRTLIIILFSLSLSAIAQPNTNYPLNVDHGQWNFDWSVFAPGSCNGCCEDYSMYFNGDTVIGSFTYQKLRKQGVAYYTDFSRPCDSIVNVFNDEVAYLRNDSANKQVFLYDTTRQVDTLLYDFSLSIGDTLKSFVYDPSQPTYPNILDSISTQNIAGISRKVFYFRDSVNHPNNTLILVEGLGFTVGDLTHLTDISFTYNFLCYKDQNGVDPAGGSCNLITSIEKENIQSQLRLYPNPAKGQINLSEVQSIERIELYDLQGKLHYIEQNEDNTQITINLPESKGVYLLNVQMKDGSTQSFKVIKE